MNLQEGDVNSLFILTLLNISDNIILTKEVMITMKKIQDNDSLIEELEKLTDLIYEDERMVINVENTIVKLKENYKLLYNKENTKKEATKNFIVNLVKKMVFSGAVVIPLSIFINPLIFILYVLLLTIFLGMETKKWLKDTEDIRTLEKTTSVDILSNGISKQEENLYELNCEIKYNKIKLKAIQEKIHLSRLRNETHEDDIIELDKIIMKRIRKIG